MAIHTCSLGTCEANPENGFTDGREIPYGFWELNPHLEEHSFLLTAETSLPQPAFPLEC